MSPAISVAKFPTSIWDTLYGDRNERSDYTPLGPGGAMRVVSEIEAIEKHLRPTADDKVIWVAPHGVAANATGAIVNPFATIAAALAAITATKKTVALMPGTYALSGIAVIPVAQTGVKIIGVGGASAVIITADNANQAFSLTPGAQGAAYVITFEGLTINQYSAKKGLYIDDTAIDGSVTVNLKDCHLVMDSSGDSIDLLHAVSGQTVILNCKDCTFTGIITVDCSNAGDRFNFTRCNLAGGLASNSGAVAAAFVFRYSILKATGVSGGASQQTVKALYCETDGDALVATSEFTGSHTESTILPVS